MELGLDPESVQKGFRIGFGLPAVQFSELRLQFAGLDAVLVGKIFLGIERVLLLHDLEKARVSLNDSVQDDLVVVLVLVLLEEREPLSLGDRDISAGCLKLSAEDPQKGGLAGAVSADNTVTVPLGEFNIDIFEKSFLSEP